jgi:FixJ family two-component response regulator
MGKPFITVAVVDNDSSVLKAADNLLSAHGFKAILFSSSEEFLASESAKEAKCLLVDIQLGGMSGIELRQRLKSDHPELQVIFMTGLDDESIRQEALQAGCLAYLRKPFAAAQLIQAIKRACADT